MPCYYPVSAWQLESGSIVFAEKGNVKRALVLPCGRCFGCRLDRSKMWAIRCMHERQMHDVSSFVTLTYDDQHLPVGGSLNYGHFQKFVKRLRKWHGGEIRYYMCGEYGEKTWRPHFHAVLFGVYFGDRVVFKNGSSGHTLYTSEALSKLWPVGHASIGDVTFESAAYVARYVIKKITGDRALEHYSRVDPRTGECVQLTPEFAHMSLKPAIGATWYAKFHQEVIDNDRVVMRGREMKPPRYYDKLLKRLADELGEDLDAYRDYARSLKPVNEADQTEARLRVRENVARAKAGFFSRDVGGT